MAGKHKVRQGRVISDKMEKTVVVEVQNTEKHPLYHKNIIKTVKFKAHDEKKISKVGDIVKIIETAPISRDKRWRVAKVMVKAAVIEIKPTEIV